MLEERPDIDNLVGVFSREEITTIVDRMMAENVRNLWLPRRLNALLSQVSLVPNRTEVFGYTAGSDPAYFLTVLDRGALATGEAVAMVGRT